MPGLFKCVLLSCAVSLVFGFTSVRDDVSWFKDGQRIKNRFVTGVVNGIVDVHCNNSANGEDVEGECLSKLECTKIGGKVGGLCSLLGSCCVIEKTCNATTSSKLSYFVSPKKFQSECELNVKVYSNDVCQIRLDFEKFDIAKPTNRDVVKGENKYSTSYQCEEDKFMVDRGKANLGFPHLCGKNTKQHIYIPVGENQDRISLNFYLKDRNGTNLLPTNPEWRIKIRQLECRKSGYENLFSAPSKLTAMYNNLKNKKKPKTDYDLIAPPHCLQYYHQQSGTFESFNYDDGRGCYIGQLNYAICFKKTPEICGAKYTNAGLFQMNSNEYTGKETEKCHPALPASPTVSQDYLMIHRGVNAAGEYGDYYCNADFNNGTVVYAKTSQPLYVGVHTDQFRANKKEDVEEDKGFAEIGFKLRYDLMSGNCEVPA